LVTALLATQSALPAAAQGSESRPSTITAWTPGGIDGPFTEAAIRVAAASGAEWVVMHRGTIPLLSVTRRDVAIQQAPAGYRYPMAALALDPRQSIPLIGREAAAALAAGEVLMGATSASLRGARPGDIIEFIGWDQSIQEVRLAAIVPDDDVGYAELVFSTQLAETFGFVRPSSVVLWDVDHEDEVVIDLLRSLPDDLARISSSADPGRIDDVLPQALLKQQFGEFAYRPNGGDDVVLDSEWFDENIVTVTLPLLGLFRCHRAIVPALEEAMDQIIEAGLSGEISRSDFQVAGGCYNSRLIRGGDKGGALSRHSWGVAIDINPSSNPYGGRVDMHPKIVEIFHSLGFGWGGGWTYTDGGHFEYNADS
jgi:hypothetical protein